MEQVPSARCYMFRVKEIKKTKNTVLILKKTQNNENTKYHDNNNNRGIGPRNKRVRR